MDVVKEDRKLVGVTVKDGKDQMETGVWSPLKRRAHERRHSMLSQYVLCINVEAL